MDSLSKEITVTPLDEGRVRLDLYLSRSLSGLSRSKAQEMIEGGLVFVNGQTVNSKFQVKSGDVVRYSDLPRAQSALEPIPMDLDVIFEDDDLIVLNKVAGIAVHPGAGEHGATLVNGLLHHSKRLGLSGSGEDEENETSDRPGIVHRLDKDTTGVMVVAKTDKAHANLSKQFHDKTNFRQYVALLNGAFPKGEWVRDSYLYRDPRERTRFASMDVNNYEHKKEREGVSDLPGYRFARTVFKLEAHYGALLSLVSLKLHTGRTHQIRLHARDLGCSIIGDQVYGKSLACLGSNTYSDEIESILLSINRQMLHAWILGFHHPSTGEWMQFEAPLPEDFAHLIGLLELYKL
jgi:23S rRNA pseudouridine1911/1915/1917 synthase